MKIYLLAPLLAFFFAFDLVAQEEIVIRNSSFEDRRRAGEVNGRSVLGWFDCNKPDQTFVDVQPGFFAVSLPASDGVSYVGMVARMDGTVEGISQSLATPLVKGQYYALAIDLAKSPSYISLSRQSGKEENFAYAVVLKIFAGNDFCDQAQLLAESVPITNENWETYYFKFKPERDFEYLILMVDYKDSKLCNGNLLLDFASDIYPVDKEEDLKAFFEN